MFAAYPVARPRNSREPAAKQRDVAAKRVFGLLAKVPISGTSGTGAVPLQGRRGSMTVSAPVVAGVNEAATERQPCARRVHLVPDGYARCVRRSRPGGV